MEGIITQFGILFLLMALFIFEGLFKLVPLYAIIAEVYSLYLDSQKKVPQQKELAKNQKLTWQELKKHDNQSSAYVAIKGKVYDVTSFLNSHPGGREFLLLNCGRDASLAFQSYHPFSEKPEKLLEKYLIGDLITTEWPTFKPDSGFYKECADRVKKYFQSKGINPKTPIPGLIRAIPLWTCFFYTFYLTFIDDSFCLTKRILIGTIFGILQALNTLHLMHDASHGAVGNNEKWWWFFGRLTLDYISGSSMLAWQNQHVIGHHQYTNIMGSDPDIPQLKEGDVRRLVKEQIWCAMYKYQHLYMPILYGLLSLRSRYYDVFEIFLKETDGPVKVNPISIQDKLRQASSKLLWLFWRYYLPVQVFGMSQSQFWFLFIYVEFITGYWLAINFQVSHVSDEAEFFYNNMDKVAKNGTNEQWPIEWAVLQIKSSVDYSHGNWLMTYLCGALNYQVIHHLFPGVSQYLYPEIAPIVLEVCKKYNLKYNLLPGFKEAWNGHFNHLKNMGKQNKFVGFAKME
ncbi:unnamed protein product [Paramecium pentaurelia]|uniref:Cytochrome b5 heme-binding domain-containing protein n=1 Tax=Paramecium pentaurelia TaxID=43138 RepID=A0A8S1TBH2_9CILI|nr:unnamed protein product [Paramecium pentaurelia]